MSFGQEPGCINFSERSIEVLKVASERISDEAEQSSRSATWAPSEAASFVQCIVKLISMGGHCYNESQTMIICQAASGLTIGMHFDGKVWSLNS